MREPLKYVSKRIEVEAMQYTVTNDQEMREWIGASFFRPRNRNGGWASKKGNAVTFSSLHKEHNWGPEIVAAVWDYLHETWVGVKKMQFIIKGTQGEFYPCDPGVMRTKYDRLFDAEEDQA